MAPAFGFAVGDFISTIALIAKVSRALQSTGGAASDYQQVRIELDSLQRILQHLERLEPCGNDTNHVNAVRAIALACKVPLQNFLDNLENFESSLGPFASKLLRSSGRKVQYSLFMTKEVEKLRAFVGAKVMSINLLLSMRYMETVYTLEKTNGERHIVLLEKSNSNQLKLQTLNDSISGVKIDITNIKRASERQTAGSIARADEIKAGIRIVDEGLKSFRADARNISSTVMSAKNIGMQILSCLNRYPSEIRDALHKMLHMDLENYNILSAMQRTLTQTLAYTTDDCFLFEDALGRSARLPYIFFKEWEVFEARLCTEFRSVPGLIKVTSGQYLILSSSNAENDINGRLIQKSDWSTMVLPKSKVTMSMIIAQLRGQHGLCPRPSCGSRKFDEISGSNFLRCPDCAIMVHSDTVELKGKPEELGNKDEDQAVFHRQVKEDELEYGPKSGTQDERNIGILASVDSPASGVEILEGQSITESHNEAYVNGGIDFIEDFSSTRDGRVPRPDRRERSKTNSETEEEGCRADSSQVLSWLGHSGGTGPQVSAVEKLRQEEDKILLFAKQLETKEMESFRNVHLVMEDGERKSSVSIAVEGQMEAQLYLRNIVDRYPHMPSYLAHRLAIANARRVERLRKLQIDLKCVQVPLPSNVQDSDDLERPPSDIGRDSDLGLIAVDALDKRDELPHGKGRLNEDAYDMPDYDSPEPQYSSQVVGEDGNDTPQWTINKDIRSASDDKSRHILMFLLEGQCRKLFNEHDEPTDHLGQILRRLAICLIDEFEPCGSPLLTPQKMQRFYQTFKLPVEIYAWQIIFEDEISSLSRIYRSLGCQHHLVQSDEEHGLSERPDIPALTTLGFDRWVTLLIQAHPNEEFRRLQSIINSDRSTSNSDDKQNGFSCILPHRLAPQSPCYIAQDSLRKAILTHCGEDGFISQYDMNENSRRKCSSSHVHDSLSPAVQDSNENILHSNLSRSSSSSGSISRYDDGSSLRKLMEETTRICSLEDNSASNSHVAGRPENSTSNSHVVDRPCRAKSGASPRANPRSSSVNSRTSSWNSTLRGSSEFDPSDQVLEFNEGEESSSEIADHDSVSQPLDFEIPHPPTELGSMPFICEVCCKQVSIEGRRAWKKHVLKDLRPYMCTFEDCEESDEVFDTQKAFIKHEIEKHRSVQFWKCPSGICSNKYSDKDSLLDHVILNHWKHLDEEARAKHAFELQEDPAIENVQCPFCQEKIKPGGRRTLARHLGQHMEKISFAAVTKPYAGWKFYDETSSEGSHEYGGKGPLSPEGVLDSDKGALKTELTVTMDRITVLDPADLSSHKQLAWEYASMKERLSNIDIDEPDALEKMEACHIILQIIIQKMTEYLEIPHGHDNSNMSMETRHTQENDGAG